jgi:hypothetical protein
MVVCYKHIKKDDKYKYEGLYYINEIYAWRHHLDHCIDKCMLSDGTGFLQFKNHTYVSKDSKDLTEREFRELFVDYYINWRDGEVDLRIQGILRSWGIDEYVIRDAFWYKDFEKIIEERYGRK